MAAKEDKEKKQINKISRKLVVNICMPELNSY